MIDELHHEQPIKTKIQTAIAAPESPPEPHPRPEKINNSGHQFGDGRALRQRQRAQLGRKQLCKSESSEAEIRILIGLELHQTLF